MMSESSLSFTILGTGSLHTYIIHFWASFEGGTLFSTCNETPTSNYSIFHAFQLKCPHNLMRNNSHIAHQCAARPKNTHYHLERRFNEWRKKEKKMNRKRSVDKNLDQSMEAASSFTTGIYPLIFLCSAAVDQKNRPTKRDGLGGVYSLTELIPDLL